MSPKKSHKNTYSVDWLTISAKGKDRSAALVTRAVEIGLGSEGQIPIQEPWFFKGFRGYRSEGVRYGHNNKGDGLVMLTGATAGSYWPAFEGLWDQCSRIDIAATIGLNTQDSMVAAREYNKLAGQKKLKTTLISNNRGGSTLYLGSRSSRRYGRIYDKGAEQAKSPGVLWRYEVELKKPVSAVFLRALEEGGDTEILIACELREYFGRYEIAFPEAPTMSYNAIEVPRDLTSDEKVLKWLERQVQPCVRKLIDKGKLMEVKAALGFEPLSIESYFNQFKENDQWP